MKSIWSDSVKLNSFNSLKDNIKTDVLIIGGGMAGLLCAYFLKKKGIDYIVVEGDKIGNGITKNTTAKVTAQHGLLYNSLIKSAGYEKAKQYLDINLWAVEEFRRLCKNINCNFQDKPAYVYSLKNRREIEEEVSAVNKLGFNAEFADNLPLPFKTEGAVKFADQGQFNPMKFIEHISQELNIYENTFIEKVSNNTAFTNHGNIKADRIIIATHYPLINLSGLYSLKLYQHRSYVLALDNAADVSGMYVDEAKNGMSFRNYENLLLVGGGDHRTGKEGGSWNELRAFAKKYYPNAIEKYAWATQDCMSLDNVPYIGQISSNYSNIYVTTGFNKWGMTSSMVSGAILADAIEGIQNPFQHVFNPSRSMLKKQLASNVLEAGVNLLSFKTKRCSHLGCALKWNSNEKTWDCPCHGSRYTEGGKVIDNPAKKNINI